MELLSSPQINELAAALSKAQSQLKGAVKDAKNPFFKSSYATLESVWESCQRPLTDNGLSVVQGVKGTALITTLMHSSGQWVQSEYPINPVKQDPQGFGSAVTYARRYSLAAMVGVFSVEDDDGNKASHPAVVRPQSPPSRLPPGYPGPVTPMPAQGQRNYAQKTAAQEHAERAIKRQDEELGKGIGRKMPPDDDRVPF